MNRETRTGTPHRTWLRPFFGIVVTPLLLSAFARNPPRDAAAIVATASLSHVEGSATPDADAHLQVAPIVGANIHISAARPSSEFNEVVVAAHPTDARRILACAMLDPGADRSVKSAAWVSSDAGRTWTDPRVTTSHWANDPTCVWTADGTALFIHKVNDGAPTPAGSVNSDFDVLGVERSRTAGRTWAPMVRGPQTNDRPFAAVDLTSGALYVAYNGHVHGEELAHDNQSFRNTVALIRSDNAAATSFHAPAQRALMDQSASAGANAGMDGIVVLPNRSVGVLYTHMTLATPSSDGVRTTTGKPTVARSALMFTRSSDSGRTLEPASLVSPVSSGYNLAHARGITGTIAVDASLGVHRGRLYVTWADFATKRGQIALTYSDDAGKTWSVSRFVNDDSAVVRANANGPDHSMATVAVNRDGVVAVMWYDRREYAGGEGYRPRLALSRDGGVTWSTSVALSAAPNEKSAQRRNDVWMPNGGDTAGLTAMADGSFFAAWVDNRTGAQQVWGARVTVTAATRELTAPRDDVRGDHRPAP
jgi:hypothetical protein